MPRKDLALRVRRRVERALSPRTPEAVPPRFRRAFRSLRPGHIAIDCGANVGAYAAVMAETGATVYAIEPDPVAFEALSRRFADVPNVVCIQAAASDTPGQRPLYMHRHASEDRLKWSVGSTLLEEKPNVDATSFVTVEVIDFDQLIGDLGDVQLVKMDVEGEEFRILRRLLQSGRIRQIHRLLVEAHDQRIPSIAEDAAQVRRDLKSSGVEHVRFDWD